MGANNVKTDDTKYRNNNDKYNDKYIVDTSVTETVPVVTEKQKELLKSMWTLLQDDIAKVGVITFVNLFETHPEVQDAFLSFRTLHVSDVEQSAVLRKHALRVMGTVEKCMSRLDNQEKFRELMLTLGTRHQQYNANPKFVDLMGPQFMLSIKPHIAGWSQEHEDAWAALFRLLSYYMKMGMTS